VETARSPFRNLARPFRMSLSLELEVSRTLSKMLFLSSREGLDALKADYELRGKLTLQFASHLARIRDYFGAVRATALSSETVDKYVSEQLEAGFKPATVNRGTQLLRQAETSDQSCLSGTWLRWSI
jgi:hypothetical protein